MKNMNTIRNAKVTVYKMINGDIAQQSWNSLQQGVRKAFCEVLNSSGINGDSSGNSNEECFVFGYSDSRIEISAMCLLKNKEAVFYFQDAMAEDTTGSFYAHNYSHGSLEVVK